MTDCTERLRRLTHAQEIILSEDLAALARIPERVRLERYEQLKAAEEEFVWEFNYDCPDFLTESEQDRVRSRFRVGRLKLAASFYHDGDVPEPLAPDFIEDELQLVVDFERYKRFDALSEEQIQRSIRRMEGEVYELVSEYHTTQLADMDAMLDNPDIQQDVLRELVSLYEERLERIRQGVFIYVGTHGLTHMVESIEEAVRAVTDAAAERESIRAEVEHALDDLPEFAGPELRAQQRTMEARLQHLERQLTTRAATPADLRGELDEYRQQVAALSQRQEAALTAFSKQIDRIAGLETRVEESISELERVHGVADEGGSETSQADETVALVAEEVRHLREQRDQLAVEREQLERERQQIESVRGRLDARQGDLEGTIERGEDTVSAAADEAITPAITPEAARMFEMDFIGGVDTAMYEASVIDTPRGPFEVSPNYWDGRSEYRSEETRLEVLLDGRGRLDRFPVNQRVRYEITKRRLFSSREREMVVEAMVLSHLEAHVFNGFDDRPATLDDLLSVVNEIVFDSEVEQTHHLVAIASPTGWDPEVTSLGGDREGEPQLRFSRYVSVVLVDLQTGTVLYDRSDRVAGGNAQLFESAAVVAVDQHDDRHPRPAAVGEDEPGERSIRDIFDGNGPS